jgi:hypothetical protein
LLNFRQVRLLLQFGASRAAVDVADAGSGARSQDEGLLNPSSRVYPSDGRGSSEARISGGLSSAVVSQVDNPEEDAKQQVAHPGPQPAVPPTARRSSNSSVQVLQLLARLIVPEVLSQAGGQNRIDCPKCGVSRSRYCCTCLLPIGPADCHPVPLLAPFQISIIQHRCVALFCNYRPSHLFFVTLYRFLSAELKNPKNHQQCHWLCSAHACA